MQIALTNPFAQVPVPKPSRRAGAPRLVRAFGQFIDFQYVDAGAFPRAAELTLYDRSGHMAPSLSRLGAILNTKA